MRTLAIDGGLSFVNAMLLTQITGICLSGTDLVELSDAVTFTAGTLAFSFLGGFQPPSNGQWAFLSAAAASRAGRRWT